MARLVLPSTEFKSSFLEAMSEFIDEGRSLDAHSYPICQPFDDFLVSRQKENTNPKPGDGRMANTDFWLIEKFSFVGRLNIRYELNETLREFGGHLGYEIRPSLRRRGYGKQILTLGLEKAKKYGLSRLLVICNEDNFASRKFIESAVGQCENTITEPNSKIRKMRYWILV